MFHYHPLVPNNSCDAGRTCERARGTGTKEDHTYPRHRICPNHRMCRRDLLAHVLRRPPGVRVPGQPIGRGDGLVLFLLPSREGKVGEEGPHRGREPVVDVVAGRPDRVTTRFRELDHAQNSEVGGYVFKLAVSVPHLVDRRDLD